jgi:uncharacterized protein YndB with AHSA1/START domain
VSQPLVIEREFDAEIDDVFAAWTDPGVMASWFFVEPGSSATVDADARVGGAFRIVITTPGGSELVTHGIYREVAPPERLQFTWNSSIASDTVVTIALSDLGGRTHLTLTHEGLPSTELVERHGSGWGEVLQNLQAAIDA